jgi:hypothetical protein
VARPARLARSRDQVCHGDLEGLDELEERPLAWPTWSARPEVRVRHLREISYSIVYRLQDRVVTIVAFAHMHRAPGYWLGRLE